MSNILVVEPELHFPFDAPFQINDQYNGKRRGTWWFRSRLSDDVEGPFHSRAKAKFFQDYEIYMLRNP